MKVHVGEEGHDVVQEYTEFKVKIGYALREDDVGKKNGNGHLHEKKPLLNSPEKIGTYQLQGC